jgi:hypothetical protein
MFHKRLEEHASTAFRKAPQDHKQDAMNNERENDRAAENDGGPHPAVPILQHIFHVGLPLGSNVTANSVSDGVSSRQDAGDAGSSLELCEPRAGLK